MRRFVVLSEDHYANGRVSIRLFDRGAELDLHVSGMVDDNGDFADDVLLNSGRILDNPISLVDSGSEEDHFGRSTDIGIRNDLIRGLLNEAIRAGRQ